MTMPDESAASTGGESLPAFTLTDLMETMDADPKTRELFLANQHRIESALAAISEMQAQDFAKLSVAATATARAFEAVLDRMKPLLDAASSLEFSDVAFARIPDNRRRVYKHGQRRGTPRHKRPDRWQPRVVYRFKDTL